jgi:charged multivesicular body protein 2A
MSFLFGGKQKTPEGKVNQMCTLPISGYLTFLVSEVMKEYKRSIDRSIRELERETTKLQTQEKKLIIDIKKTAKETQNMVVDLDPRCGLFRNLLTNFSLQAVVNIKAKDLVRTRNLITKFYTMKSHMQSVSLRLQTIKSTQVIESRIFPHQRDLLQI